MRLNKMAFVPALALLVASCAPAVATADKGWPTAQKIGVTDGSNIYYFRDNENGNICYIVDQGRYDSNPTISCLPMRDDNVQSN